MKALLAALCLFSLPTYAQYAHRANPGSASAAPATITALNGSVCLNTESTDVMFISVTGTWAATLSFTGSNDQGTTSKTLMVFPYNAAGGLAASVASTTANGDFMGSTNSFRLVCVTATAFTSGTANIRIDSDPGPFITTQVGLGFNGQNQIPRYCDKVTRVNTTIAAAASNIQIIPAVAGQFVYVCGYQLGVSTATTGTALTWVEGGGANCASGTATLFNPLITTPTTAPTTPNLVYGPINPAPQFTGTVNDALCLSQASTTNTTTVTGWVSWTQN